MPEISQEEYDRLKGLEPKIEQLNSEAAAHRRAKAEAVAQLNEATQQIKTLQEAIEKPNADFKAKEAELIEALRKSKEHGEALRAKYEGKLIDEAVLTAATKGRAIDPSVVSKLLRDSIGIDEKGEIFVRAGDGVATDTTGARVSVDSYVSGYLEKNAFLVAPSGAAGTGSQGGRGAGDQSGGKTITRAEFDKLDPRAKSAKIKEGVELVD